jgi:hypothetical protein
MKAQTSENKNGLTYKFVITDYVTLDLAYQNGNDPDKIMHPEAINYAGEIGYFRYVNKSLNIGMPIRFGSLDSFHEITDTSFCAACAERKTNELFISADIVAVYKFNNGYLLQENFILAPYLFLGVSGVYMSQRDGKFDVQIPMGLGLNIKLTELLYLQAQFEYRKSLVIKKDNFAISAGISWLLDFKKKNN